MQDNSPEIVFGRQQSAHVKGVAVVLLILHHLFLFPSSNPWFTSILGNSWGGIEFFLSSVGKLCISLFFFVSGYGLYQSSLSDRFLWKSTGKRLRSIYLIYVITALVSIAILWGWTGVSPIHSWGQAIATMLGLDVSVNASWWFFIIYVELLVLTPLAVRFVRRFSWQWLFACSFIVYFFSPDTGLAFFAQWLTNMGLAAIFYNHFFINLFWMNQLYFFVGFCLAASGRFEAGLRKSIHIFSQQWQRQIAGILLISLVFGFRYFFLDIGSALGVLSRENVNIYTYTTLNSRPDFLLAPIFIYGLTLLCYQRSWPVLSFLGNNSAAIWLIHGTVLFIVIQSVTAYHLWSPLVFLAVVLLSVVYALVYSYSFKVASRKYLEGSAGG